MVLAITAFCSQIAGAQAKVNPAGKWDLAVESPNGTIQASADLKVDGEKVTGTLNSHLGERVVTGTIKGNQLTLVYSVKVQDNDVTITLTGTVDGDTMKGTGDVGGFAQIDWSAKRSGASAPASVATGQGTTSNISGAWVFEVVTEQGNGSPTFVFKQDGEKLTGQYKGAFGEGPLEGTVKGTAIKFSAAVNAQGQELTVTYTGTIEGSGMKGTVTLGDLASGTWTGKRQ